MKLSIPKWDYIIGIVLFYIANIFTTYFITSDVFNIYISNFSRSFVSELLSIMGNSAILTLIILIIFSIAKKTHNRFLALGITSIVLTILLYAISIFSKYYAAFFSISTFTIFKNPTQNLRNMIVTESIICLFTTGFFLLLIPGIGLIIYSVFLRKKHYQYSFNNKKFSYIFRLSLLLLSIIFSLTSFFTTKEIAKKDWPYNSDLPLYTIQHTGVLNYYVYELIGLRVKYNYADDVEEATVISNLNTINRDSSTYDPLFTISSQDSLGEGLFNGKNLYLLQLESVNEFALNLKINEKYLMPNLRNIVENSYYFSNFYTNSGQGVTADCELALMTGIRASGYDTLHWDYETNPYDFETLPELFKAKGYSTYSFHGDTELFYNRTPVHENLFGFDEYYSKEDYLLTNPSITDDPNSYIGEWISDERMIDWSYELLEGVTEPYFAYNILTVSHTPYMYNPMEEIPLEDLENWPTSNKILTRYLRYMAYVDSYFDDFYTHMQNDLDTIYIIVSDHGCGISDGHLEDILGDMTYNEMLTYLAKVPAMIYDNSGALETLMGLDMNQELLRSQVDLYDTIKTLFSLNGSYSFNLNALSNEKTFTYLPIGFYILTDDYFYSVKNPTLSALNNYTNYLSEVEYIKRYKLIIDQAVQMNVYKTLIN